MSGDDCKQHDSTLEALAAGHFDDLTPQQAEAVATHLDACPVCSARLSDIVAAPAAPLERDTAELADSDWAPVWSKIEAAATGERRAPEARRSLRTLIGLASAAAVVVAATLWQLSPMTPQQTWELTMATGDDVNIEFIDAYGANLYTVETEGTSIIWVTEE